MIALNEFCAVGSGSRKTWGPIYVVVLLLCGCGTEGRTDPNPETCIKHVWNEQPVQSTPRNPLSVTTFNVFYANQNYQITANAILESGATIVALQETTPGLERFLSAYLRRHYPYQHFAGFRDQFFGERFGLLAKVPLENVTFHPPVHGLFGQLSAEFRWEGRLTKFINVHLEPFARTSLRIDPSLRKNPFRGNRRDLEAGRPGPTDVDCRRLE